MPQHVCARGHNRKALFHDDKERWLYLNELQASTVQHGCELHAYALMTNHVHLLVTAHMQGALGRMMHRLGTRFARFVNVRHQATGAVFEGRYHSSLVDSKGYLLACMRYIEENPVRARMVHHPSEYSWSSHDANVSGNPGAPLTAHALYWGLGRDADERGRCYKELFGKPMLEVQLAAIRASLAKDRALGDSAFLDQLEADLGRPVAAAPHGGDRKSGGGIKGTCSLTRPLDLG
jgi:putative transposase